MTADTQSADTGPLTLEKLADEVRHLTGQVVLMHDLTFAALMGVGIDEDDLYYIGRPQGRGRDPIWYSAVGACAGIKEHLPEAMYARIENIFVLNGGLPTTFEMMVQLEGAEPVVYDPEVHPALREAVQHRQYEETLARVARENAIYLAEQSSKD